MRLFLLNQKRSHFLFFTGLMPIFVGLAFLTISIHSNDAEAIEVDFEHDSTLPLVYLNVIIDGGSVAEPEGKSGLTNFMSRMLLRGTHSRTKEEINLEIDRMGARLEVDPRLESVILRGAVLSSELEPYLALLKDIITQPSFSEKEINLVKDQQISFILENQGDDETVTWINFNRFLFGRHPYAKSVLGRIAEIKTFKRDDVVRLYDHLVHHSSLTVLGSGDAAQEQITSWAEEIKRLRPDREKDFKTIQVSVPEDEKRRRLLLIDKPDRTQTQIYIGQTGIRMSDEDYFPLHIGNNVFGGPTMTTTLMEEIRIKKGWSYGANSWFKFGLQPRSWQVYLFPTVKDAAPALAYTLRLIEELKKNGLSEDQFQFAKQSLIKKSGFLYSTARKRVENKILEKTLNLPSGFTKSYAAKLNEVTIEQTNQSLKKLLQPDRLTIGVLATAAPLKSELAKAAGVNEDEVEIIPYTHD